MKKQQHLSDSEEVKVSNGGVEQKQSAGSMYLSRECSMLDN
jgi:hypothetical protein